MRVDAPFDIEDVKDEILNKKEIEDFDIDKFESDDKELSEIIEYTKKTHHKDLLNLCERMYYSIKNGIRIDQYVYTAKEIYKEIKKDNQLDKYSKKTSIIKELEKKLKEEINRQDELKNNIKTLKEKQELSIDSISKPIDRLEELEIIEEPTDDYDDEVINLSLAKDDDNPNIDLLLLDNDITKDFVNFEEKELDEDTLYLEYQTEENKKYTSIVDTNIDKLVDNINNIYTTAEKMKASKDRNEIIDLFNDTLNDIKTYYKYKEYVRYYYNGYKDNLEEGEDYENHKELLSDLSDKINIIINSMRHYLNINSIGYTELNDKYNFDDNTSTLVHKILDESLFQSIYNNDVLKTIYNKELVSNTTLK